MKQVRTIIEAMGEPEILGSFIAKSPASWSAWRTFFKSIYGLPLDNAEFELYKSCTGRTQRPAGPFSSVCAIIGRRGGKSSAVGMLVVWEAISRPWQKILSPGERVHLVVVAVDRAQAGVILRYAKGIFHSSQWLRDQIETEKAEELELKNSVIISVKTASFRSLRGLTMGIFVGDETAFWRTEDSANPDREILVAARPALATVNGRVVLISTPYSRTGVMYETFKSGWGADDSPVLVWRAPSVVMNPTLRQSFIDAQLADDPAANRAEWLAEFREDIERFISPEILEPCIVRDRGDLPRAPGVEVLWTMDPSGGRSDSFCLCGSHVNADGILVVDVLRERKPPFSPDAVVAEFAGLIKQQYGSRRVVSDRYAGEWVAESFRKHDIIVKPSDFSASESYLELLPKITSRKIELPDNRKLVAQLVGLERRTRPSGGDTVTHGPAGHDDLANVVALAAAHQEGSSMDNWASRPGCYFTGSGGMPTTVTEFPRGEIPEEFAPFATIKFAIRWQGAIIAAGHDLRKAAELVGEDLKLMREFNSIFHGFLSKVCRFRLAEIQEAAAKFEEKLKK